MRRLLPLIGLILISSLQAGLPTAVNGQALPSLAPMLEKATPAVVNITTRGKSTRTYNLPFSDDPLFKRFFDLPSIERIQETSSLGSGVIVDASEGLILTNFHVVENAYEINVALTDGRELRAKVLGRDPKTDVAVIRVKAKDLVQIPMADSSKLQVGDFVVAIGNPFGLGQTVTSGIVSALGRSGLGVDSIEDFIQTDASINLGNSGGALVNLRGELVGINTAIFGGGTQGSIGIGFAIPINMANDIMRQLVENGEVERGRLGAQGQDLTPMLAQAFNISRNNGFIVTQVEAGSPAEKAGIQVGDVVVSANAKPIRSASDMHNVVGLQRFGQSIDLALFREGKEEHVSVEIQPIEVKQIDGAIIHPQLAGASIGEMREQRLQRGRIDYLQVMTVKKSSSAWEAGFRSGDVIFSINKQVTRNFDEAFDLAEDSERGMILNIQRGNREHYILLK